MRNGRSATPWPIGCIFCGWATIMSLSRHHRYLLNPRLACFYAGDDSFRIDNNHACHTYERWRDGAELYPLRSEARGDGEDLVQHLRRLLVVFVFTIYFFQSIHFLIYRSFPQPNRNHKTAPTVLLVQHPPCRLRHASYQRHRRIPQP